MAGSGYFVRPESYSCPLCMDVLRDPVNIPCGDTFCLDCIKLYWDQADHVGVYSCPQCRATFTPRPALQQYVTNSGQDCRNWPEQPSFPALQQDTLCDFCTGHRNKAIKSCLMCLAYYCEVHIKPHYESATFKRHKLVDEMGHLDRKICPQHEKGFELFCRSDQMCICVLCTVREHRSHNIVSAEEERAEKQKALIVTQNDVQNVIQERMKELQELKHNVETLKGHGQRAMADSDKIFTEMIQAVERWHSEITCLIESTEQACMTQAQGYMERLEMEIMELQQRDADLRHILDTEDSIHFLQNFPTLCVPPEPIVPKVVINPEFSFRDVTKNVTGMKDHLEDICKKELNKISKTVPSRVDLQEPKTREDFLKYSCQLTLDPNTAYKELMLSDGNQKVTRKKTALFYADHPERFDGFSQVLCREALSGSRYYWEVQWSGEFSIGVAYKSINRKGKNSSSLLGYNDKSWSMLCSDTGYSVWHNKLDKDLPCSSHAARVGVYLDHRGGSLAFYAVSQSMELIYKFQAKFTEPLYAGFGVGSTVSICHLRDSFSNLH
ncbi:tripartite motif-containing protein 16 isoform X2 [Paramormyrops kingsleyae]|uniref:E3 ubiquitin/ISG15 ligase TRIM25-like n=1 Tax=Paramormyrops kingsleyae TaxID=1676925 RepID=A0A3B3T2P7_9TELE|nr:tripartite motif-containing protein 16-like isoform X2 [Paramormyrops kingsleyae]